MKCPFCSVGSCQVLESRVVKGEHSIRRRRECEKCKKRFTTYEEVRSSILWVIKKDGRRESFSAEKVKSGILRAIEKRPVSIEAVNDIVERVTKECLRKQKEEVSSKYIGRSVLRKLKSLDMVAWLRFASVYLEFEDISDFEKAIEKI